MEYCWYAALLVPASAASCLALPPQPKARRSPCRGHSFRPNSRSFGSMIHKLSSLLRFAHLRFLWSVAAADAAHPLLVTFSYDASFHVVQVAGLEFTGAHRRFLGLGAAQGSDWRYSSSGLHGGVRGPVLDSAEFSRGASAAASCLPLAMILVVVLRLLAAG